MKNHELVGMMGDGTPISECFDDFSFYCKLDQTLY